MRKAEALVARVEGRDEVPVDAPAAPTPAPEEPPAPAQEPPPSLEPELDLPPSLDPSVDVPPPNDDAKITFERSLEPTLERTEELVPESQPEPELEPTASPEIPPPADLPLDAVAPVSEAATTAFQVDEEPLDSASVPDPDPLAVELPSSPPLPTPTFIFDTLNTNGASKPKTNGAAAVDEPEPVGGSGKALAGEVELGHENGDVAVLE